MHFLSLLSFLITFFPSSLFHCKNTVHNTYHIQNTCPSTFRLSVSILVNRGLLVKFLGSQKLYMNFWLCRASGPLNLSHYSWGNCTLTQQTHQCVSFTQFYGTKCELPGTILEALTGCPVHCTYAIIVSSLNIHLVSSVSYISGTEFGIQI